MDVTETINEKQHKTALILANAAELTSLIIKKTAGNDISTAINGSPATREIIQSILLRSLAKKICETAKV